MITLCLYTFIKMLWESLHVKTNTLFTLSIFVQTSLGYYLCNPPHLGVPSGMEYRKTRKRGNRKRRDNKGIKKRKRQRNEASIHK